MPQEKMHRTIHWFRKGLRLHDNPALLAACEGSSHIYPIFILDPWFAKNARVGINRWRFLIETLQDLDDSLAKLNSRLYVVRGNPKEVLPSLFKEWKITRLTYEEDTEPYAKTRDAEAAALAKEHDVELVTRVSHTLYDIQKTVAKNGGRPPLTMQRLQTVLSMMGPPPRPQPTLSAEHLKGTETPTDSKHAKRYGVPTLEELGKDGATLGPVLYPGGETTAIERMEKYMKKVNWVCSFEKPKTEPNSLEPSTTVLSPYLKFGCLSARTFYYKLDEVYKIGKKHTNPPVSLHGQLLWREMFYTIGAVSPNFDQMVDNPISRQIPWGTNQEHLEAWKNGKTGFPFIDAVMTQLRQEGWIHHLARHSVACFLTRGDLWISWEEGQKVFEELLLDADWSLNAGNWMWLSASAFFHQYFRVYSPIAFGKKTDKDGNYIKKYLPMLKKFPAKFIYEPWTAPRQLQERAGCIIGKDYPKPIVDHDVARKANIEKMAAAYNSAKGDKEPAKKKEPAKRKAESAKGTPTKKQKKERKITDFVKK